jgi:hypothetical protein
MCPPEDGKGYADYTLNGRCSEFKADILLSLPIKNRKVEETTESYRNQFLKERGKGVIFRVWGDKKLLHKDSIFSYNETKPISISIDSVNVLRLEVELIKKGDVSGANSCWANARVIVK